MQVRREHDPAPPERRRADFVATGFTLVELTLIIFLAGVLVALALPRFLAGDVDRHEAEVQGVVAGLATALELYQGQQQVIASDPSRAQIAPEFAALAANANGYPYAQITGFGPEDTQDDTTAYGLSLTPVAVDADDCIALWNGLLQSAAPVVQAATELDDLLGSAAPYTAVIDEAVCQYFHTAAGNEPGDRVAVIRYDTNSGALSRVAYVLRPAQR